MANIKQQKKRVGIAARQRLENLRYKSTAKTLLKSLQDHVNLGDKETASKVHGQLVSLLDRAASKHALHPNTASRKKARAYRVLISEPAIEATKVRRAKKKSTTRKSAAAPAAAATTTKPKAAAKPSKAAAKPAKADAKPADAVDETTTDATATEAPEAVADEAPESATPAAPQVDEDAPAEDAAADEASTEG